MELSTVVGFVKGITSILPTIANAAQRNPRIVQLMRNMGMLFVLKPEFEVVYAHTVVAYSEECEKNSLDLIPDWMALLGNEAAITGFKECWEAYIETHPTGNAEQWGAVLYGLIQQRDSGHLLLKDKTRQEVDERAKIFCRLFGEMTQKSRTPAEAQAYSEQHLIHCKIEELESSSGEISNSLKEGLSAIHKFLNLLLIRQDETLAIVKQQSFEQFKNYINAYRNDITGNNNVLIGDVKNSNITINLLVEDIAAYLKKEGRELKKQALANYRFYLQALFDDRVLNDSKGMTLADIYIPPHFAIHRISLAKGTKCDTHHFYTLPKKPYLHDFVSTLLPAHKDKSRLPDSECIERHDAKVILLLGDPGQGKSSFCKHLLQECIERKPEQKVFFIPLRYVDNPRQWINNPIGCIVEQIENDLNNKYIPEGERCNFEQNELNNALIILDGLDELCMIENMDKREAEGFCKELLHKCHGASFKVIVTSRYGYVDTAQLEKLPLLVLQLSPLSVEQQQVWLQKYRLFHPETPLTREKLDAYNRQEHLAELLNQAILLHIIATLNRDIDPKSNRGYIYQRLFDELCEANWKQDEGQLDNLRDINSAMLRGILQRMAFEIYTNQQTYITRQQLEALGEEDSEFGEFVKNKGMDFSKTLLMASYMRRSDAAQPGAGTQSYQAIEFLHKSLQEYLTAEYLWQQLKDELCATQTKGGRGPFVLQQADVLRLCDRLFTPQSLLPEESVVKQCLADIIRNDNSPQKDTAGERLRYFWEEIMPYQFLCPPSDTSNTPHILPTERMRRSFYAYWLCLKILHPKKDLQPESENLRQIMTELWRILGFVYSYPLDLSHQNLGRYSLIGADLRGANLSSANLSSANLSSANLSSANLSRTDLSSTNLSRANLSRANLSRTDLSSADLSGSDLSGANLIGANLSRADLRGTNLSSANLSSAYLRGANLSSAYLSDVNLSGADLSGADLSGANLSRADLSSADLSSANLSRANLSSANLSDANLIGANLRGANLSDANLIGANLIGANLRGANLRGADLRGADLRGANLRGADLSSADLSSADLSSADLIGADLIGADLRGADLRGTNLSSANLSSAYLRGANLSSAYLSDVNLSGADLSGANLSDANLIGANLIGANLRGANLRGADLRGADLRGANLRGADLSSADLSSADLSSADLIGADLIGADLRGADLRGADLSSANLSSAYLRGANLSSAYLSDVNLSGADLSGADLSGADLSRADLSYTKTNQPDWFEHWLRHEYSPKGLAGLSERYYIDPTLQKDVEGCIYYLIKSK